MMNLKRILINIKVFIQHFMIFSVTNVTLNVDLESLKRYLFFFYLNH